jgi:hypothetical protein
MKPMSYKQPEGPGYSAEELQAIAEKYNLPDGTILCETKDKNFAIKFATPMDTFKHEGLKQLMEDMGLGICDGSIRDVCNGNYQTVVKK